MVVEGNQKGTHMDKEDAKLHTGTQPKDCKDPSYTILFLNKLPNRPISTRVSLPNKSPMSRYSSEQEQVLLGSRISHQRRPESRGVSGMGRGGGGGGSVCAEDAHEPENMGRCIESHKINKR